MGNRRGKRKRSGTNGPSGRMSGEKSAKSLETVSRKGLKESEGNITTESIEILSKRKGQKIRAGSKHRK